MATYRRRLRARSSTIPTRVLLASGAVLVGAAAASVVRGEDGVAGAAALLAGVAGIAGGRIAVWIDDGLSRFYDPLLDRCFDGAVLGAIAWVARDRRPSIAIGALVAISAGFLASYVRAKGASLGYEVQESTVTRGIRYALVGGGLAFGWLPWSVWGVAILGLLASSIRTLQVAKEELA